MLYKHLQQSSLYKQSVLQTLRVYEKYILPSNVKRVNLLDLKRNEFEDRKKLLNPY